MDFESQPSWQIHLIIALGVILAVVAAFLLAQLDITQRRSNLPVRQLPIVDLQATIAAGDLSIVYLPGEVTLTPYPTRTPEPTETPEGYQPVTAVPVLALACTKAPPNWTAYIVRAGDSLSWLAVRFGISVNAIIQANCLTHAQIIPGQQLLLPQNQENNNKAILCGVPQGWVQYVVRPGDTLMKLARQSGNTVLGLMQANCLESTYLMNGRKIFLPPITNPVMKPPARESFPTATRRLPLITPSPTKKVPLFTPTYSAGSTSTTFPTLTPVNIETSTITPSITLTQPPTYTSVPSQTPTPVETELSPASSTPTDSPPSSTPQPTDTPESSSTPIPTNTPQPTDTPIPPLPSDTPPSAIIASPSPTIPPQSTLPPSYPEP